MNERRPADNANGAPNASSDGQPPRRMLPIWAAALIGAAVGVAVLWLLVWYAITHIAESWAGIGGVVYTPLALLCGAIAGGAVQFWRVGRMRRAAERSRSAQRTTREREQDVRALRAARRLAFAAVGLAIPLALLFVRPGPGALPGAAWLAALAVAATVPPFAVVAFILRDDAPPPAVGFASGLAWTVSALLLVTAVDAAAFFSAFHRPESVLTTVQLTVFNFAARGGLLPLAALTIVCLTMGGTLAPVVRRRWSGGRGLGDARRGLAAGVGGAVAWAAVCVPILVTANTSVRAHASTREAAELRTSNEAIVGMTRALRQVVSCLTTHVRAHPDAAPPPTLTVLGPAGDGCLSDSLAAGTLPGPWRLRRDVGWEAAPPDEGFWIVAEPANPGERFLYADAAGRIYATYFFARRDSLLRARGDARLVAPVPLPPPAGQQLVPFASPIRPLVELRFCVHRELQDPRYAPPNSDCHAARQPDGGFGDMELRVRGRVNALLEPIVARYRVRFERTADALGDTTFTLSARPVAYVTDGLVSLFADAAGVVHWTAEDRDATADDPPVSDCERDGQECRFGQAPPAPRSDGAPQPRVILP